MKYTSIFISTFLLLTVHLNQADAKTIFVEKWQVLHVQDNELSSVTGRTDWEPIHIPSTFREPGPSSQKFQYLWLKGELNISDSISEYYGINLGRIYHTDTVYINSIYAGSLNQNEINVLHLPRYYIIPRGALITGQNVIYIRLGIFSNEYGGFKSQVCIQDKNTFLNEQIIDNFFINSLPFGIAILYIGAATFLFAFFFFYTRNNSTFKANRVIYQLMTANSGLYFFIVVILFIFSPYKVINLSSYYLDLIYLFHLTIIPLVTINIAIFIQSLYGRYFFVFNFIALPVFLIISGMFFINKLFFHSQPIDIILISIYFISSLLLFKYLMSRLNFYKPKRFIKNAVILFILFAEMTIALEAIMYLTGQCNSGLAAAYISPFVVCIMLVVYSRILVDKWYELESLYDSLRKSVQHQKISSQKVSITNDNEEKLQQVIKFINENYTSDLSWEGIAAAVDMTPGYLGRLFTSYTGKKFNNYINDQRIQMAVEKLNDRDIKIIDIAYAVGFESLSTFNRAFKNRTGKTPTDYREQMSPPRGKAADIKF